MSHGHGFVEAAADEGNCSIFRLKARAPSCHALPPLMTQKRLVIRAGSGCQSRGWAGIDVKRPSRIATADVAAKGERYKSAEPAPLPSSTNSERGCSRS